MSISIQHGGNALQALAANAGLSATSGNPLIAGLDFSALLDGQLAGQADIQALTGTALPGTALRDLPKQLSGKSISTTVDRDTAPATSDLLQAMLEGNPELAKQLAGDKLSASSQLASSADERIEVDAREAGANDTLPNMAWLIPALPAPTNPLMPTRNGQTLPRSDSDILQQHLVGSEARNLDLATPAARAHFSATMTVDRNETSPLATFSLTALDGGKDEATAKIAVNETTTPAQFPGTLAAQSTGLPRDTVTHTIPTPLHSTEWTQDFGNRVVWLARSDQQTAQININPANLGPIQINLSLQGDQMSANFVSAHSEVRQAIEDALPRLREMLSNSGIALGDANVGAQLPQQQRDLPAQLAKPSRLADENAILGREGVSATLTTSLPIQRGQGLVDLFA